MSHKGCFWNETNLLSFVLPYNDISTVIPQYFAEGLSFILLYKWLQFHNNKPFRIEIKMFKFQN